MSNILIQGTYGMNEDEKFFTRHYQAYIADKKHTFQEVSGVHTTAIGSLPVHGPLQVVEQPGVTINMSRADYEKMCKKLHDVYQEEYHRTLNEEAYNLWMRYKVYVELMK